MNLDEILAPAQLELHRAAMFNLSMDFSLAIHQPIERILSGQELLEVRIQLQASATGAVIRAGGRAACFG